jgi:hypothetical protein
VTVVLDEKEPSLHKIIPASMKLSRWAFITLVAGAGATCAYGVLGSCNLLVSRACCTLTGPEPYRPQDPFSCGGGTCTPLITSNPAMNNIEPVPPGGSGRVSGEPYQSALCTWHNAYCNNEGVCVRYAASRSEVCTSWILLGDVCEVDGPENPDHPGS